MYYERSYLRSCQVSTLEQKNMAILSKNKKGNLNHFARLMIDCNDTFIDAGFLVLNVIDQNYNG